MKRIPLTQGKFALVDDDCFEAINQFKWCAAKSRNIFYAARHIPNGKNRQKLIFMHREILGITSSRLHADHCDGDGLNNQRHNLRACTHTQNQQNQGLQKNNTSGFKGVTKNRNKWEARIAYNGKRTVIGYFPTPEQAAIAYNEAAIRYHGNFAHLNKF